MTEENSRTCYKCGKETPYSVVACGGSFILDDSRKRVCEQHLLLGSLDAYKDGAKNDPYLWVSVYRDMSKEEAETIDKEHPYLAMSHFVELPEMTQRARDIVKQYRLKHGTYQR